MTCVYNFTVGEYVTMRENFCTSCTTVKGLLGDAAACRAPGCIAGGGRVRIVSAVNHQIPGPKIEVCLGDRVVVQVTNHFSSEGVVIHWHGTHQRGTPYMDGTPYLTQCPILPYTSFVYDFIADTPGTHMWHAHIGFEEADGVFGTMIVRRPAAKELHSSLYDEDLSEHSMIVWHWFGKSTREVLTVSKYTGTRSSGEGLIINGLGGLEAFELPPEEDTFDTMPREVFTVEQGQRYRFRVIYNNQIPCPVQLSVQNHSLLVIASDGASFTPVPANSIMLNGGERYDFILEANQTDNNYWIRFRGLGNCENDARKVHQEAVLHYADADEALPEAEPTYEDAVATGMVVNPIGAIAYNYSGNELTYVAELENVDVEQAQNISGDVNQIIYIEFRNSMYVSEDIVGPWPQVNSRTFSYPSFPLLTQRHEITQDMYCTDEDVCVDGSFCACSYLYDIELGSLVEIVFIDLGRGGGDHPFHMHGGQFHVVAQNVIDGDISKQIVRELNEQNGISKNLGGPLKDTVSVPSSGYAVIRFVADNPGFWFFHCHITSHADMGMGFVLKVGDFDEMPYPPYDFPRCGNWEPGTENDLPSGTAGGAQVGVIVIVLCWFVLSVTNFGV
ncbi:oxidoreductase OpS5-like [Zootermopsis nevadensis]|uniref:oxidoreductase OpS5-like n=1 Tax=Zootermopsis nevadensis TaxID=136037 RepID=UPI000B8E353C|nr:oxidoreductase OpS5-like [Zootermopsis nevadensis]XP_021918367.1 oxidoreductase OpS5-like [Zootermopsis nevadensis]XP_021918368.1 oxidoreductase OpS5-like [Zootermopsis nevadensis]XP_021918369.1 oxidoreductase OpS5-like [Zootermopsis nevadensis]